MLVVSLLLMYVYYMYNAVEHFRNGLVSFPLGLMSHM